MSASRGWLTALLATMSLWAVMPAAAHEVRPALLALEETAAGDILVLWKRPVVENGVLAVTPLFPAGCPRTDVRAQVLDGAYLERFRLHCPNGLPTRIEFRGLPATLTSVFVRRRSAAGEDSRAVATGAAPSVDFRAERPALLAYLGLGVEHILLGIDHLAFVLGLVLLVRRWKPLVLTITAFTLAHSLTLAVAALGLIGLPARPVEVVIAFSIVVVAREAFLASRGVTQLAARVPVLLAFGFGLLHGFGFAGALAEVGLPRDATLLALLLFNLGVELGQLVVLALLVPLLFWASRRFAAHAAAGQRVLAAALGSVASFWLLQRLLA